MEMNQTKITLLMASDYRGACPACMVVCNSCFINIGRGQRKVSGINDPMTVGSNGTPKIEFPTSQEKTYI